MVPEVLKAEEHHTDTGMISSFTEMPVTARGLWRGGGLPGRSHPTPLLCQQRIVGIEYHPSLPYPVDISSDVPWDADGRGEGCHTTQPLFVCCGFNFKRAEVNLSFLSGQA